MIQGTHYTLLALLQSQMQSAKWPRSYPEDTSPGRAGCIGTQSIQYLFHTGIRGFPPALNKKNHQAYEFPPSTQT